MSANINHQVENTKVSAEQAVQSIPYHVLEAVVAHLRSLHLLELNLCSTLNDETKLRQSQGAARALTTVADLLTHRPVAQRRTTSRPEV